jgi:PAS domain S-box-containing protein
MKYTYLSPATINIHGYSLEEIFQSDKKFFDYYTPESKAKVQKLIKQKTDQFKRGEIDKLNAVFDTIFIHKDGYYVYAEVSAAAITDEAGNLTKFYGITRNVNEKKKLELALKESDKKFTTITEKSVDFI